MDDEWDEYSHPNGEQVKQYLERDPSSTVVATAVVFVGVIAGIYFFVFERMSPVPEHLILYPLLAVSIGILVSAILGPLLGAAIRGDL